MLATVLTIALASVAAAAPCPAAFEIHTNGNNDYCVTAGSITQYGSLITSQRCNGSPEQLWNWEQDAGQEVVHLRNPGGTQCLAAEEYRISGWYNGRQLENSGCYNDGAQDWKLTGSGQIVMGGNVGGNSNECMDLRDGKLDGGAVQIWYCTPGNTNQIWTL